MPKELQPRTDVPTWDSMSPGEKQAWLLDMALDVKKNILSAPLPGLRIAARAEHADEALRLRAGRLAKLLEADGRLDVVALWTVLKSTENPEELANHVLPNDGHLE